MLLNLLLSYNVGLKNYNNKVFNKIMIISFLVYWLSYVTFGNFILLICIFDSIFFIQKYIDLVFENEYSNKEIEQLNTTKNIIKPAIKSFIDKINDIDQIKITKKVTKDLKKISIDPEFEKDNYKLYKYELKDTFAQVTNNL